MTLETISNIAQIIFADLILSGDNALVIGMAAAGLASMYRGGTTALDSAAPCM